MNDARNAATYGYSSKRLTRVGIENAVSAAIVIGLNVWISVFSELDSHAGQCFAVGSIVALGAKFLLGPCLQVSNLTIPAMFLLAYFCLMALPSLMIYSEMDHWARSNYLWCIQSVLVTFPAGVLLATSCFSESGKRVEAYAADRLHITPGDVAFRQMVYLVFWVAVGVAGIYIAVSEFIPIMKLFVDYSAEIDDLSLRFSITELPRALLFALALSRSLLIPLCMLYLYFMWVAGGSIWRRDFMFVFLTGMVVACLSLERAPAMVLCCMLLFGVAIANTQRLFRLKALRAYATVASIALVVTGLISAIQYDSEADLGEVQDGVQHVVVNRILLASARTSAMAFEYFPSEDSQLRGQYIRMFCLLTGREYLESRYAPRLVILPVSFVGDLWRNWGWPAVLLGGLVAGFGTQAVQVALLRRKTVISAVFQAILILVWIWLIPGNAFGIVTTSLLLCSSVGGYWAIGKSLRSTAAHQNKPQVAPLAGRASRTAA